MNSIDEHIQKDQEEFLKALADHNDGKVRHLTEELQWLLDHKKQFPEDSHDPTPLSCSVNRTRTSRNAWSTTTESAADYWLSTNTLRCTAVRQM